MPTWLAEILRTSSPSACIAALIYFLYRLASAIVTRPIAIATIFAVLGGRTRRADARTVVQILSAQPHTQRDYDDPATKTS